MLRNEESGEKQFQRYVELGRDNATCISGMRRWCRHVELEPAASGLYAEVTGLPIGAHSVACPYVNGKTESMNVRWIVSDFLAQHCTGCPHHSPNGDVSWGQQIIDEQAASVAPWPDCASCLTVSDPSAGLLNRLADPRRPVPDGLRLRSALIIAPYAAIEGLQHPLGVAATPRPSQIIGLKASPPLSAPLSSGQTSATHPFGGFGLSRQRPATLHRRAPRR